MCAMDSQKLCMCDLYMLKFFNKAQLHNNKIHLLVFGMCQAFMIFFCKCGEIFEY